MRPGYVDTITLPYEGNGWVTTTFHIIDGDKIGFVSLTFFHDQWELEHLWSVTRGGGRAALQFVCEMADRENMPLELIVCPSFSPGGKRMSMAELTQWYETFGFQESERVTCSSDMRREPASGVFPKCVDALDVQVLARWMTPPTSAWVEQSRFMPTLSARSGAIAPTVAGQE